MARLKSRTVSKQTPITHREVVDIPSNYYLENSVGWLSVVVPEQSENVIRNPQLLDLNNNNIPDAYSPAFIAVTETYLPTGGPYSGGSYLSTNVTDGAFASTQSNQLPAATYTPSWVLRGHGQVRLRVTDTFNTISEIIYNLTDEWTQFVGPSFTYTALSFFVMFIEPVGTVPSLEIGFFQLENIDHATTPFDGSFSGYQFESADVYSWTGVPNQSTSIRTDNTITGGQVINLAEEFGLCITAVEGFGIPSELNVVSSPYALRKGSLVRCKTLESRALTIEAQLLKCNYKQLLCSRSSMGKALFSQSKQRKFIWQPIDNCMPCPCVEFIACLTDGFQGTTDNLYGENIELELTMFDPEFRSCYSQTDSLNLNDAQDFNALLAVTTEGAIVNPLLEPSTPTILTMFDVCVSPYDGKMYYTIDNGATTDRELWRYDGAVHTQIGLFGLSTNPAHVNDFGIRIECCGKYLYVGGAFTDVVGMSGFAGTSGQSIGQFDLQSGVVTDIGDVLDSGLQGIVTAINCINSSTGEMAIGGLFTNAGTAIALNLSRYDALASTFIDNSFPIGSGQITQILYYFENGNKRVMYVGNFQNNTDITWANVDNSLPESIAWFNGTQVVRTDFIFDISGVGVPVSNVTSVARLNDTIFVGGNFGDVNTDVALWVGSSSVRHRGIAVLDITQFQNSFLGDIQGRLLPLNGDMDASPPTGQGADGPRPLINLDGIIDLEIVRDMAVVNGELYVVGAVHEFGLIDSDGIVDPTRGIIDPKITACGGFIWTPSATDARIGTARLLDFDVTSLDISGIDCRLVGVVAVEPGTPNLLGWSHIYEIDANSFNLASLDLGGQTTITLCDNDFEDLPLRIHVEGPADIERITVNNIVVMESANNPIIVPLGETFIANYENIPATFTVSTGQIINTQTFRQATLDSPTNNVILKLTAGSTQVGITNAYLSYRPAHISAEYLQCSPCNN